MFAGLLSPEAFQHYVNQFGAAYAPAFAAGYPAPVGYGPPPPIPPAANGFATPFVVQTGYEGLLVPNNTPEQTNQQPTHLVPSAMTMLSHLLSTLMMSTVFKVVATIVSALVMLLFSGAITTAICNLTPICDITFKAANYFRSKGAAEGMGYLAEEITPERVKRASEFVHNAIRKYRELQKLLQQEDEKRK